MKKTTFILLFMLVPFFCTAQTFDFTNTDDGWTETSAFTATNNATFISLKTVDGDGTKKNPVFGTLTAGIDTTVNSFVGITLKNNGATEPTYMRVSYPKDGGDASKRVYKNLDISAGDTEFVTYWIDLSNTKNWIGTMNDIQIHFKNADNGDFIIPNAPDNAVIDIDKIEFTAAIPTTLKESFSFSTDDDTEGFITSNASISGPTGGILTLTPVELKFAKLTQNLHHVNATANKTVTIVLKNNSPVNDQLRFIGGGTTQTLIMTTSDTEAKTYVFDLKDNVDWTGEQSFSIGIGISTGDNAGKAADDGTVEFSSIVVDNTQVLSVKNNVFKNLSIYPNPASTVVNIASKNTISKIQLFNLIGKKVLETKTLINKTLNVSTLNKGVYFLKVYSTENKIATQKLIIK